MEIRNGFASRLSSKGELITVTSNTQEEIDNFADRIWPQRTTSGESLWSSFVSLSSTDFGYGVKYNNEFYVLDPRTRYQQSANETLIRRVRLSEDNLYILGLSGPVPANVDEFTDSDLDSIEFKTNIPMDKKDLS